MGEAPRIDRIGRFAVMRRIGAGSFASVWLAQDEDLGVPVAIKLLEERWATHAGVLRHFLEEARVLRVLPNDRIVEVHQIDRLPDGRPYMVMDFVEGGGLDQRIRARAAAGEPYPVEEALDLSIGIADCLLEVHALGIVHRDLKPGNVLFQPEAPALVAARRDAGEPIAPERMLLTDFGVASHESEGWEGESGLGTAHYVAPEQADPATRRGSDHRVDLYSAAVILYELLTFRVPFPYPTVAQVLAAQRTQAPPALRDARPGLPGDLIGAVHRGLAANPTWRFDTTAEWIDLLRDIRAALPAP